MYFKRGSPPVLHPAGGEAPLLATAGQNPSLIVKVALQWVASTESVHPKPPE
jgi:hypothetical protein